MLLINETIYYDSLQRGVFISKTNSNEIQIKHNYSGKYINLLFVYCVGKYMEC